MTVVTGPEYSVCAECSASRNGLSFDPFNTGTQYYPHFTGEEIEAYLVNKHLTDPLRFPSYREAKVTELNQPRSCG